MEESMHQGQGQQSDDGSRKAMIIATVALHGIATIGNVFLHRGFGSRYLGIQALAPLLIIPMFGMLFPDHDQRGLLTLLAIYLFALFAVRIDSMFRRPAEGLHSRYDGTPYLMLIVPRANELTIKRFVEPLLVSLVGIWVLSWDPPLGAFLLLTAFVMAATVNSAEAAERMRAMELADSLIEQRQIGYRIRSHGGRF
jgi:hypothetical protein